MKLCAANSHHLTELMSWFPDRKTCLNWGGPNFRFPFTAASFTEDIHWDTLPSYSLVGEKGALSGFGQYYLREGRCHLGRLAISPACRGQGLGRLLVEQLSEIGCNDLGADQCSLFVLEDNLAAIQCYRKSGFEFAAYPGEMPPLEGCLYMTAIPAYQENQ
jgi:ribosomal protein S18 acetylase RimI-like enzyme